MFKTGHWTFIASHCFWELCCLLILHNKATCSMWQHTSIQSSRTQKKMWLCRKGPLLPQRGPVLMLACTLLTLWAVGRAWLGQHDWFTAVNKLQRLGITDAFLSGATFAYSGTLTIKSQSNVLSIDAHHCRTGTPKTRVAALEMLWPAYLPLFNLLHSPISRISNTFTLRTKCSPSYPTIIKLISTTHQWS